MRTDPESAGEGEPPSIAAALLEQRELTAVDRFAQRHAEETGPQQARYYRDLLPGGPPDVGEHFAFRVDLDACTGCKACVTACHSLNGLASDEAWRAVGETLSTDACGQGGFQTVTSSCHHCEDPACLRGCPVRAYEKDPRTGIVIHLDDQCIGCQYCLLECPYEAPQYRPELGIVRKCDMCVERLDAGEAPACVQGCPSEAISIEVVSARDLAEPLLRSAEETMPPTTLTRPTTRYVSARRGPPPVPVDLERVAPAAAHDPLAVMLVCFQLSIGILGAHLVTGGIPGSLPLALLAAVAGSVAATTHLGRPWLAHRAILGWRTSWMSREIICFGAYVGLLVLAVGSSWLGVGGIKPLSWAALAVGLLGGVCSVLIYADTGRPAWSFGRTAARFAASGLILGSAAGAAFSFASGAATTGALIAVVALAAATLKLASELLDARASRKRPPALWRAAKLLRHDLRTAFSARLLAGGAGLVLLGASWIVPAAPLAFLGLVALLVGELLERSLFFRAEAMPGMPGA